MKGSVLGVFDAVSGAEADATADRLSSYERDRRGGGNTAADVDAAVEE